MRPSKNDTSGAWKTVSPLRSYMRDGKSVVGVAEDARIGDSSHVFGTADMYVSDNWPPAGEKTALSGAISSLWRGRVAGDSRSSAGASRPARAIPLPQREPRRSGRRGSLGSDAPIPTPGPTDRSRSPDRRPSGAPSKSRRSAPRFETWRSREAALRIGDSRPVFGTADI